MGPQDREPEPVRSMGNGDRRDDRFLPGVDEPAFVGGGVGMVQGDAGAEGDDRLQWSSPAAH